MHTQRPNINSFITRHLSFVIRPSLLLLLLVTFAHAQSPDLPPPLPITLANQRLTVFPTAVTNAVVAPDGRPWLELRPPHVHAYLDLDTVQDLIEREFDAPVPQLTWARPVLFEPRPNKPTRVWFIATARQKPAGDVYALLLAFDGKTWLVHPLQPNVLHDALNLKATAIDGRIFFTTRSQVLSFDNSRWTDFTFNLPKDSDLEPRLFPEPDNKGLLAVITSANTRPARNPEGSPYSESISAHSLWRFRDNVWTKLPWTGYNPVYRDYPSTIASLAPTPAGVYILALTHEKSTTLHFLPYAPSSPATSTAPATQPDPKTLAALSTDALLAQYLSADTATRQLAESLLLTRSDLRRCSLPPHFRFCDMYFRLTPARTASLHVCRPIYPSAALSQFEAASNCHPPPFNPHSNPPT